MSGNLALAFSYEKILETAQSLAESIRLDLNENCGAPDTVTFVVLLKGGARFAFDLMARYAGRYYYDFAGVSSYNEGTSSSGVIDLYQFAPRRELIDSRVVVLLDDICDSGRTFARVVESIKREFEPQAVRTCALIRRESSVFRPDFIGFTAGGEDYFVGYGMGIGEEYRHLNGIYSVTPG